MPNPLAMYELMHFLNVQSDKNTHPEEIEVQRTKYQTAKILSVIEKKTSAVDRKAMSSRYAL